MSGGSDPRLISIERGAATARDELLRCLAAGGVALFPADGLYGLACDPLDPAAIERIHALKGRRGDKPSAVMYLDRVTMRELLTGLGDRTRAALGALLPGPVTLVLPNPERRYPLACGKDPERIGVRLIEGPLAGMPMPMFQTSANRSGAEAPASLQEVDPDLLAGVDLAIDGGRLTGAPSTVIDLSRLEAQGRWVILREGALPTDRVAAILGP